MASHPLRMRGLKLLRIADAIGCPVVASFADAWIETTIVLILGIIGASHPLRMRGLKPKADLDPDTLFRRILCGCVD